MSRQRIHDAALRLFGRHGFDGVSMQMLADEVGLHKSTLFHHYQSKLDIAVEVFDATLRRVVDALAPLGTDPPRLEDFHRGVDLLTDWWCRDPDSARLIMAFITAPRESELLVGTASQAADLQRQLFTLLGGWLTRAKRAGLIGALNVRQAMVNLVGLVLFYPAVARDLAGGQVAGSEAFSPKSVRIRKAELRRLLDGMLGTTDSPSPGRTSGTR